MCLDKKNDYYWYWLCNIEGIGRAKIRRLLDRYKDACSVYQNIEDDAFLAAGVSEKDLQRLREAKKSARQYEEFCRVKDEGIRFIHMQSADYPERLARIPDAPVGIYVKGQPDTDDVPTVAIIGARGCSDYGRQMAYSIGKEMAYLGICVISGMALGTDTAGQRGCVEAGGMSVAVLGCGVDVCYPRENMGLYMSLMERGGVISEYPPGTRPEKYHFPERNRIISGLADVVIVVEARKRSGSFITVDQALEQNKEIMAVPGRVGDPLSEGCNELIKMGASVMTSIDDIKKTGVIYRWLKEQKITEKNNFKISKIQQSKDLERDLLKKININPLASEKNIVYSTTNLYPKDMDTIIKETGLDVSVVSRELFELQLQGAVKETSGNCYVRCDIY